MKDEYLGLKLVLLVFNFPGLRLSTFDFSLLRSMRRQQYRAPTIATKSFQKWSFVDHVPRVDELMGLLFGRPRWRYKPAAANISIPSVACDRRPTAPRQSGYRDAASKQRCCARFGNNWRPQHGVTVTIHTDSGADNRAVIINSVCPRGEHVETQSS